MLGMEWLLTFTETVKHGSFAAAARELGTTPSTVAKAVGRLESKLRLRLFHRTTRRVTLTSDGERLFDRCRRVIAELEGLQAEALGTLTKPCGTAGGPAGRVRSRARDARDRPARGQASGTAVGCAAVGCLRRSGRGGRGPGDPHRRHGGLAPGGEAHREPGLGPVCRAGLPGRPCRPEDVSALAGHRAILFRMPTSGRDQVWHFREGRRQRDFRAVAQFRFSDGEAWPRPPNWGWVSRNCPTTW